MSDVSDAKDANDVNEADRNRELEVQDAARVAVGEGDAVDRDRLEASLERVRARVKDPRAGLFGPGSIAWRIYREQAVAVGGGCALLLQTAHPYVAHAVKAHSAYRTDPFGRTERTFRALYSWVFGDLDRAIGSARRTWERHRVVRGTFPRPVGVHGAEDAYAANEQHALMWVHATLWETPFRVYERLFRPLSREERDRYYEETKVFAGLFGIDDDHLPPTFDDFLAYHNAMVASEVLEVDDASRAVSRYVLSPPHPAAAPAFELLRIMTAGLLPARIRHGYRLRWGRFEEAAFEAAIRSLRTSVRRTPAMLRYSPVYRRAAHRVAGTRPGRLEKRFNHTYRTLEDRVMHGMGPRVPDTARAA